MTDPLQISKVNSVVIFDHEDDMDAHVQALQAMIDDDVISGIVSLCRKCKSSDDPAARCLVRGVFSLLSTLESRTKVGWWRLQTWLKTREANQELAQLVRDFQDVTSTAELNNFLARNHQSIKDQLSRLLDFEQSDLFLLVVSDFQLIRVEEQPLVADVLLRLTKGTPAYFRILYLGDRPTLFRKSDLGETGIQLDHDYVEISMERDPPPEEDVPGQDLSQELHGSENSDLQPDALTKEEVPEADLDEAEPDLDQAS